MNKLLHSSQAFVKRNASTILTCVGSLGVVATSVMAVKATPKALLILEEAEKEKGEELTKTEKVLAAGPVYIPSIAVGASTIVCIFSANLLNKRSQAALTSAYAFLDNSYKDYKKKVNELYGDEATQKVAEGIAEDKYEKIDILEDDKTLLFFDEFSGRFFRSTIEAVQRAQYEINRDLSLRDWATVNEYYELLGLDPVDSGDLIGWSTGMNFDYYWQAWIDFSNHKTVMDDGTEYYIITMFQEPMIDYEYY